MFYYNRRCSCTSQWLTMTGSAHLNQLDALSSAAIPAARNSDTGATCWPIPGVLSHSGTRYRKCQRKAKGMNLYCDFHWPYLAQLYRREWCLVMNSSYCRVGQTIDIIQFTCGIDLRS